LAEKVAGETQGGYLFYLQTEKNNLNAKYNQNMNTGKVSKLSKEQKQAAAKV